MENPISKRLRIILFSVVLIFIVIVSVFFSTSTNQLKNEHVHAYNESWDIYMNDQLIGDAKVPSLVDAKGNDTITLSKLLSSDFQNEQTLLVRGSLQNITVNIDGQLIYDKNFESNAFDTYASIYHFIDVPNDSNGKTIEITLVSPYDNMSGTINDIYYGTPSAIEDHLIATHGFKVYIALFMLSLSIIFIIINFFFFRKEHPYNSFLGLFGIFISLWLFAESRIVQLYINYDFLIGSLAYISLATAPIAIIAFIKSYIFKKDRYLFSGLCIIFTINLLLVLLFHMIGVAAFFESVISTIILILIGFIITLVTLLKSYIQTKKIIYRNFLVIFITFSFFLFTEVFAFMNKNYNDTAILASIGIAVILLVIFVINIILLSFKVKDSFEKQAYEEIARTDQLTKAKSRFAFENDLDHLFYDSDNVISMIYFDFDDLKSINDHFGHIEGDKTLILGFNTIKQIFGKYGECYRIGGDEFACVSSEISEALFNKLKKSMTNLLNDINRDLPYKIQISIGFTIQDLNQDQKPSELIQKADYNMYIDKAKNKALLKNSKNR